MVMANASLTVLDHCSISTLGLDDTFPAAPFDDDDVIEIMTFDWQKRKILPPEVSPGGQLQYALQGCDNASFQFNLRLKDIWRPIIASRISTKSLAYCRSNVSSQFPINWQHFYSARAM